MWRCFTLVVCSGLLAVAAVETDQPRITSLIEWFGTGKARAVGHRVHPTRRQVQPLLDHPLRDPSICRGPDGWYYLTGTDGTPILPDYGAVDFNNNDGIRVWRSQDLKEWEFVTKALELQMPEHHWQRKREDNWMRRPWFNEQGEWVRGVQAPEIHYIKDTFWIVYSINNVAGGLLKSTSGTAEGPYEQWAQVEGGGYGHQGSRLFISGGSPSLFADDDGVVYLLWGQGKIARLSEDMRQLAEPPRALVCVAPAPEDGKHVQDAPVHVGHSGYFMAKREGRYHLFATDRSIRGGAPVEDVYVASADSPYGPFDFPRWSIPHAGQTTVFTGSDGEWQASYCGNDPHAAFTDRAGVVPMGWTKSDHGALIPRPERPFPRRLLAVNTERYLWHRLPPISQYPLRDTQACRAPDGAIIYTGSHVTKHTKGKLFLYRSMDMVNWEEIEIWDWGCQEKLFAKPYKGRDPRTTDNEQVFSYMDTEVWYLNDTFYVGFAVYEGDPVGTILKSTTGKVEGPYEPVYSGGLAQVSFFEDTDGKKYQTTNASGRQWKDGLSGPMDDAPWLHFEAADGSSNVGDAAGQMALIHGKYVNFTCGVDGPHFLRGHSDPGSYTWNYQTADSLDGPWSRERVIGPHVGHGALVEDRFGNWWACSFANEASQGQAGFNFMTAYIHPLEVRMENGELSISMADRLPDYVEQALQAKEDEK